LFPFEPGAIIKSKGLKTMTNFDVYCTVKNGDEIFYSDSTHVDSLSPNMSETIKFEPLMILENGDYSFIIEFMNLSDD